MVVLIVGTVLAISVAFKTDRESMDGESKMKASADETDDLPGYCRSYLFVRQQKVRAFSVY